MTPREFKRRINTLANHEQLAARVPSVITYPFAGGEPTAEDIARRWPLREGACMLAPIFGDGGVGAWEAAAVEAQRRLKAEVRL